MIEELIILGTIALAALSEAIFFPVPPDVFLIYYSYVNPELWFLYATISTIFSISGGFLGYEIGKIFHERIKKMVGVENVKKVQDIYKKYGSYGIFIAGLSPIPYKIFTLSSGILKYNFKEFIFYSFFSRALRFYAISYITAEYGKEVVESYINDPVLMALTIILAIILVFILKFLKESKVLKKHLNKGKG